MNDHDPLDPLTHYRSAWRARIAERRAYTAYALDHGTIGGTIALRSEAHWACYDADILDRRQRDGLADYEADTWDELQRHLEDNATGQDPSMALLHGSVFYLEVSAAIPADPVYMVDRQYNTGPFWDGFPRGPRR